MKKEKKNQQPFSKKTLLITCPILWEVNMFTAF